MASKLSKGGMGIPEGAMGWFILGVYTLFPCLVEGDSFAGMPLKFSPKIFSLT